MGYQHPQTQAVVGLLVYIFEPKSAILMALSAILNFILAQSTSFWMSVVVVQLLRTKTMPFTKSFLQHRPISPIFETKFNRIELKKRYLAATFKIIDQMSKNCLVQKFPIQRITCESLESICSAVPSKRWSYTVKNFLSYPISRYDESDGKIKQNQCISFGVCLAMRTPQVK